MENSTPKPNRSRRIFIVVLILISGGGFGVFKYKQHQAKFTPENYEQKKQTVAEMEKANAAKFLISSGDFNKNLLGTKYKIHGKVTNTATIANFKDVRLKVRFYSETKTEMEQREFVISNFFPANSSTDFDLKIDRPTECKNISWEIVTATAY